MLLPRVYPILDTGSFTKVGDIFRFVERLQDGGARLLQLRAKHSSSQELLDVALELRSLSHPETRWIMNDRADLCLAGGFDGVHVGQDDPSVKAARHIVGSSRWIGVSTHNLPQVIEADSTDADYVAIGPIFPTRSKPDPDPVVGLEALRAVRQVTKKPLVAIGGITRENASSVIEAGADSVALISALQGDPHKTIEAFFAVLR